MGFLDKFFGRKPRPQPTERASVENAEDFELVDSTALVEAAASWLDLAA